MRVLPVPAIPNLDRESGSGGDPNACGLDFVSEITLRTGRSRPVSPADPMR
jgi:hypothetical protein